MSASSATNQMDQGRMLQVVGVSKRYGSVDALVDVDLSVGAGEIVGLLGPNGAGKTSLLSMVVGLRRPDTGRVLVDGLDPARSDRARRRIGFAPQTTGTYPSLRVADNLRLYARIAGLRRQALEARVEETAAALDLIDLLGRKAETLSGGERRRVHIACAVVTRPPLLVFDEATAGVDVDSRRRLIQFVHTLARDGTAVLYSTHYLQEVEHRDLRIVILDHGRVIAHGGVGELLDRHGRAVVELVFDGTAPSLPLGWPATRRANVLRIAADEPAAVLAAALRALGREVERLSGVEIVRANLDTVFAELTGRRFDIAPEPDTVASLTEIKSNVVSA
jgi:ABC-2 type transport system ATP-binding protein